MHEFIFQFELRLLRLQFFAIEFGGFVIILISWICYCSNKPSKIEYSNVRRSHKHNWNHNFGHWQVTLPTLCSIFYDFLLNMSSESIKNVLFICWYSWQNEYRYQRHSEITSLHIYIFFRLAQMLDWRQNEWRQNEFIRHHPKNQMLLWTQWALCFRPKYKNRWRNQPYGSVVVLSTSFASFENKRQYSVNISMATHESVNTVFAIYIRLNATWKIFAVKFVLIYFRCVFSLCQTEMDPFCQAISLYRRKRYDDCITICNGLLQMNPEQKGPWELKMRAMTQRVYVDDIEADDGLAGNFDEPKSKKENEKSA